MEAGNPPGGGGESHFTSVADVTEDLEETTESDSVTQLGEVDQLQQNDENNESVTSLTPVTHKRVMSELTLVLIGDKHSIDIRPENILFDHDAQSKVGPFSSRLYDLCGRHVSVINLLGLKNTEKLPVNQGVHAFLLLVPHSLHEDQYRAGLQWLEAAFGKESLSYVMTVVTHESDTNCESAVTDLTANSTFTEQRFHTCMRTMTDEGEMIDLLDKIDAMVSENDPHSYSSMMPDGITEQEGDLSKSHKDKNNSSSTGSLHMDMSGEKDEPSTLRAEAETLFRRLDLEDKQHQKLSPADILQINPPVNQDHVTSEKDLAHTFLQRLMMLDYRARYIPVKQETPTSVPVLDTVDTKHALFKRSRNTVKTKQAHVHPMDVQMSVFHCSDSFLKQILITKLSQCQYALPLLVPDPLTMDMECPLWTFRQIIKTWKTTQTKDDSNTVTMKNMPICKAQTPMVSFVRLGSLSVSKSQLINTLINDRHSAFFHRNCPGSTKSRLLMEGVAEIAWYCPAGKPSDAFTDCTAFCNLHGDALLADKQRHILTDKSSLNVVLVPTLEEEDKSTSVITALYESDKPLIVLVADDYCDAVQMNQGKYQLGLNDRTLSEVAEELKRIIVEILSRPHQSFQLETMAEVSGIRVDESDTFNKGGKEAAMTLVKFFSKNKNQFLPCQGELWHDWCRTNKELYHLKGGEKEKNEKEQKLMKIRQDQCEVSCSELMKLFIENLSSHQTTEKLYFLKWTQILLDALSTDDASSLLCSYDAKSSEVMALQKKHDKPHLLKIKKSELQSAAFGLEHMFREMGQIYEAHKSVQKPTKTVQTDWSKYPELAAELMISGHPMELMDGDAGHVPLTWISSLLDAAIRKLGDQKVFVLSVLGVQSSGKSTLLNAMFGLQFAVSAGRCTKGAFMQLVKVSEQMKKDFHFDYVLVVDTEGLRALELADNTSLHRDNELATFVVGLGNMTLINIFGENPADIQDVLQIVVQAFMRMKKVQLSPSCVFVHQNVTDIAAAQKNMDGKTQLQKKLDQMTKLAAKEEFCDAECFSDVIAFDVQEDVKYFAQLWEGSPPMAPPNPGYSESIQDLKKIILSKASQSAGTNLSHFKTKIQDLWNALMNENFVFSFKNTQEIAVYRKLEVQYGNWTWTLRSNMLTIENQLYTRTENETLNKDESDDLFKEMSKTYEEVQKDMKTYFDDDKEKETLVQWRGRLEIKIKEFHDEQVSGVKRKLDDVLQQKKTCKKLDEQKTEFENKLLQKSKELAHQLKDEAKDEEEVEKQFNSVWSLWVGELTADIKPTENINLENDQTIILQELSFEGKLINERRQKQTYKNLSDLQDYDDYVSKVRILKIPIYRKSLSPEEQEQIRSFIDDVERISIKTIESKPVATRGYNQTYLHEVAKDVKDKVTDFESKKKYALKREFTVDLILYVFRRAENWLSKSHNKFKMKNDPHSYLEEKKDQYYNIFRSFFKGSSSAVVLGELICDKLKVSTAEAVCNQAAIDLAGEMRCSFPAFSGNRLNLEKHVLTSLAEKEDFQSFINYIQHPRKHVETFIKEEVQKYIFTDHRDKAQNILKKNADDVSKLVSLALFTATEEVKTQRGDMDMWLQEFTSQLKHKLTLGTISSQNFSDIQHFDLLKEEIERGLKSIIDEMINFSLDNMNNFRLQPDQNLIDHLCNCCWVKCPFCAALCTNTMKDHDGDHSVPFHRSEAVRGWYYTDTEELGVDFCTTNVASDRGFYPSHDSEKSILFKHYRTGGPEYANWSITPDGSKLTYWKWFICRFQKDLEDHHSKTFQGRGEIPSEWWKYDKKDAIQSLDEMYNVS